ncbi:MAG: preprotein translocase subunit SecA [Actinobacteria bacterium]|nr:preprotein translocase subunit SecA [Actinomycetota bacterium]
MKLFTKIFGDPNEKVIKSLQPIVDEINGLEEKFKKMSDEELKSMTGKFREKLGVRDNNPKSEIRNLKSEMDSMLPEAFAVVREAARRVLGQRHYDVQLIGGVVLHRGQIGEMRTGEGKTLVATLPLYLNALAGKGAHLVTVNDYLSRVGAGWMAPVYHALGLTIGIIIHDAALRYDPEYIDDSQYDERLKHFKPVSRREAYECDITYGTNNEYGFDYLRDNMAPSLEAMVQRGLNFAIVDEVDSILIDEARTPLIISAPAEESTDKYSKFAQLVERLVENDDYNVDEKMRAATLSESGISKMEKWLGVDNIYTTGGVRDVHHIEQALKARVLFQKDKDYVVKEGEVIIVDEFTGRMMHGRRYSDGLHQAIEAKEGVKIQRESQTLATITFQNYFRMYNKLSGMTGTAITEAEEFSKIYNLETVVAPTHRPMVRKDLNDLIYRVERGKYAALIKEVKKRSEKGQPVLVGTISIEKNELLADLMEREGLRPQVLNAKNHLKEAQIIADAGKLGAVTIATNMAGRGVDIMLGGTEPGKNTKEHEEWKKERQKVIDLGGLHVIGTERHESRRIDNQLRGRAGRQGDPGSSRFYVSCDDDLMRIFGGDRMKSIMNTLKLPDDTPIENKIISRSIESAQKKVEGNNFDIRKHLVEYDDVLNKHRTSIYKKRESILEAVGGDMENFGQTQNSKLKTQNLLSNIILEMVENEIEQVVIFHTAGERISDWNLDEIREVASTIFPVSENLKDDLKYIIKDGEKLDRAKARTEIIEYLIKAANENYKNLSEQAQGAGLNWQEIEKSILVRSIDTLWVEHLDVMSSLRQGIGLRGYGQRDPLIEYKKEAYGLYNELNNLIQKEVVYSIFKVGQVQEIIAPNLSDRAKEFSAPAKEMNNNNTSFSGFKGMSADSASAAQQGKAPADIGVGKLKADDSIDMVKQKVKNSEGDKVGRNDPCPCGSGKKFKKCCGK